MNRSTVSVNQDWRKALEKALEKKAHKPEPETIHDLDRHDPPDEDKPKKPKKKHE